MGASAHKIHVPGEVVDDQAGGGVVNDDEPVAPTCGLLQRAAAQVAARDRDPPGDLGFQGAEGGPLGELRLGAIAGQRLDLPSRVRYVAMAAHPLEDLDCTGVSRTMNRR